ncbi:MAG: sigma 54-interacting transcriptional regulator [Planctomycetota bacterium]|jgi:transcriptional regulator with GAF, ATPase, and Fis domain
MSRVIVTGPRGKDVVPIKGEVLSIGRAEENDIQIKEPESSRHHCKILRSEGAFKLVDLGSRNGTLVNGRRVQWSILREGDQIRIGKTKIYLGHIPKGQEGRVETAPGPAVGAASPVATLPAVDPASLSRLVRDVGEETGAHAPGLQAETIEKLRRLLDINRDIASELDPKRLLERILDAAIEVSGAERGFVVLKERGDIRIKVSRNLDKETIRKAEAKVSRSVLKRVLQEGIVISVDDAGTDGRFSQADSVIGLNLAAILCVPLRARKDVIGALYLDNRFRSSGFTHSHQRLAEVVADQAAIAIENNRLFIDNLQKQKELEAAHRELEELNKALKAKVAQQGRELDDVRHQLIRREPPKLKHRYDKIITRSPRMDEVLRVIDRVVEHDAFVHVQGESGTGKELIARAIHDNSPRKGLFIAQNCAAVPTQLMESLFFGYQRGAFTGANQDKPGLFEMADGGTLFLDEIGEMVPELQSKFLRVLQSGEIRRVGAKNTRQVNVRVISATNRDLAQLVRDGEFREDLYYRIVVIHVKLPPLRDRPEDIPLLVEHFLAEIAERTGRPKKSVGPEPLEVLLRYDWAGNVRQLQNELERAVALSGDEITDEHFSRDVREGRSSLRSLPQTRALDTLDLKELVRDAQIEVERAAIEEALRQARTKSDAAKLLGVSRPTLDAKIDKYSIVWRRK